VKLMMKTTAFGNTVTEGHLSVGVLGVLDEVIQYPLFVVTIVEILGMQAIKRCGKRGIAAGVREGTYRRERSKKYTSAQRFTSHEETQSFTRLEVS
jgi:hypothetical protein